MIEVVMETPGNNTETDARSDDQSINRRRFVKAIGATGAGASVGALTAGSAAAKQASERHIDELTAEEKSKIKTELKEARDRYRSPTDAKTALQITGRDIFNELSSQGFIASASPESFETEEMTSSTTHNEQQERMGVTSFIHNDTPTAHIYTSKKFDDGMITVVVEPQITRSYAIIQDKPNLSANRANVQILESSAGIHSNEITENTTSTSDIVTSSAMRAGQYCLYDDSDDDPTGGDNCFYECEAYKFYCGFDSDGSVNRCYLGTFTTCCDNPCSGVGRPCAFTLDCSYCTQSC